MAKTAGIDQARQEKGLPVGGEFKATAHAPSGVVLELLADAAAKTVTEVQYIGGGSDKFWRAEVEGCDVTVTYGRNGTAGKADTTTFDSPEKAAAFAAKKLKEKQAKGYQLVAGASGSGPAVHLDDIAVDQTVLPQLAKIVDPDDVPRLMTDDTYVMQPKLDGERVVLALRSGGIGAFNRQGQPKQKNVSEAHIEPFRDLEGDWTFDGEVVGRTYHVFDLTSAPGMSPNTPFEERYALLDRTLRDLEVDPAAVRIVPTAMGNAQKARMRADAKANSGEGVIFRKRSALNAPGRRDEGLLKDKFVKEADVVVTAVHPTKDSATLSVRGTDGKMKEVGQVSTIGKGDVRVGSVLEVTFLNAGTDAANPRMFQPRIARHRVDKSADECNLDQFAHAVANKTYVGEDLAEED